ncbi:MAG: ATP-binding cassette domain-containing protein [Ignavibacteriaceae bacterium]
MLSLTNVEFSYAKQLVFTDLNLELDEGEFAFLIGKSGVGKSTLLQLIYMNLLPLSGYVRVNGYDSSTIKGRQLPDLRKKLGLIFQDFKLLQDRNVYENLLFVGEQQRVGIARALLNDPILVLADEPTGNLDPETSREILDILVKINKKGTAVLVATHNYDIVKSINARIIKLEKGKAFKAVIKGKTN